MIYTRSSKIKRPDGYEDAALFDEMELLQVIVELLDSEDARNVDSLFRKIADLLVTELAEQFKAAEALDGLAAKRALRTSLSLSLGQFLRYLTTLIRSVNAEAAEPWEALSDRVLDSNFAEEKLIELLRNGVHWETAIKTLPCELVSQQPHAIYPTSPFRESSGNVVSSADFRQVEASMSLKTYTSIRIEEGVLKTDNRMLRDVYKPLGRCVCLVDQNVRRTFWLGDRCIFCVTTTSSLKSWFIERWRSTKESARSKKCWVISNGWEFPETSPCW